MSGETKATERRNDPKSNTRIEDRVVEVCDAVGAFIETWGFRSIHGRVWTLLAVSATPLSQAQIAERLRVSRSLVHLAVSELSEFTLVQPISAQRNAPYRARMDVWPTITGVLRKREWMLMETTRVALEALRQDLSEDPEGQERYEMAKVEVLLLMTELAQATLRGVFSLRIPESLEGFAGWLRRARNVADRLRRHLPRLLRTGP